jgi:hypothetical protein
MFSTARLIHSPSAGIDEGSISGPDFSPSDRENRTSYALQADFR